LAETLHEFFQSLELGPLVLLLLALGATIEYLFPPFPGDTVVLLGAFMVGARDWNPLAVYLAITGGNLLGMAFTYGAGCFIRDRDRAWRERFSIWKRLGTGIDRLMPHFSKRVRVYLLLNRFLPSIRALFFLAAGMARYPFHRVLLLGGVSALAWNALLLVAGAALGGNWEKLLALFGRYNKIAWCAVALALLLGWVFLRLRKKES